MGLFDFLKGAAAGKEAPSAPEALAVQTTPGELAAPVSGRAVAMADVPDEAFAEGVLGKGCGIWPDTETVFAPVSGEVSVLMGHAVGIVSDDGVEVLVHVGMDTVSLEGKGFTPYVAQGDHVTAGQPVLSFSRKVIADAGFADCVVLAVSNTAAFADVTMVAPVGAHIEAGQPAVKVARA